MDTEGDTDTEDDVDTTKMQSRLRVTKKVDKMQGSLSLTSKSMSSS